jgi:hypothetical protein
LQQYAKRTTDIIGAEIGKTFSANPALHKEPVSVGNTHQRPLKPARLVSQYQRWITA